MNFNKILPSEISADVCYKVEGESSSYIEIKSDDIIVWKNWNENNSIHLMYNYLESKFNVFFNKKPSDSLIIDVTLPDSISPEKEKKFEDMLVSFLRAEGFSVGNSKDFTSGVPYIHHYFDYLAGMTDKEALYVVNSHIANTKLSEDEKVKKAEELIFSFSTKLWTDAQVKARVDQILDLKVDFKLINPARRDENRHSQQWFLDLLNYTNIAQWEPDYEGDSYRAKGNWANNAVAIAVELLPYIGSLELLRLDGKEYKPDLDWGKEMGEWSLSPLRPEEKDILDIVINRNFTYYEQLPKEHFFILMKNILEGCQLTKNRASNMSYCIMSG